MISNCIGFSFTSRFCLKMSITAMLGFFGVSEFSASGVLVFSFGVAGHPCVGLRLAGRESP